MHGIRRPAVVLAAAALTLSACGGSGGGDDSGPITVGQITSLTGNYTPLGTNDRLGVAQAVKEINDAGGLLGGRQVKVVVKDDRTQPDQSVVAFNDLTGQSVVGILGSPFGNSALATIPLVGRKKIPYISTSATDEQVDPVQPYVFMTPATARNWAERLMQYFQAVGLTKIALAHDGKSAYARTGWNDMKDMADRYGVTFVADEQFETTTTDFGPVFTHVRDSGAQALMVWATGAPAVLFTKQFATAGLPMKLVFSGAEASSLFTQPAGSAAEGVIVESAVGVVGPQLPPSKVRDATLAMAQPFQRANGAYPPQFALDGYAAMKLLAAAITKAGSTDPAKVRDALEQTSLLTPSGEYHYSAKDHAGLAPTDISVNVVRGGQFVPTDWSATELKKTLK